MNKSAVETITELFRPQAPLWACELTSKHVIIAGLSGQRDKVKSRIAAELAPGTVMGSLTDANVVNTDAARSNVLEALNRAGFDGSEIAVVIPDDAVRIAFLSVEKLSKDSGEQITFIRWKLKKTVPFDVDTAQVAFKVIGPHHAGPGTDLLVTLSPRSVVEEYERLFDSLEIHAGLVVPSTLAALNLLDAPARDTLFLKIAPDCVTTSIFQYGRMQFYRRVADVSLYDAVYPTIMYHEDKLGGQKLEQLVVCGYESDARSMAEIQEKLGLTPQRLDPKEIDDIYKPALGGVHFRNA